MLLQQVRRILIKCTVEIWSFVKDIIQAFVQDHAIRLAASLAFYTTFSITPALLIGLSVAGTVIGNMRAESELIAAVGRLINPEAAEYVFGFVGHLSEELQGKHLPLMGIIGALVAATAVFVELQSALDVIWHTSFPRRQSLLTIIRARAISFVFVVGIGILLLVSIVTGTVLSAINSLFMRTHLIPQDILQWLQILVQYGMVPLLLACTYKLIPDIDIEWKDVLLGAVVTAILFLLGKSIFGMYLRFTILGSVYGAAGSLFILLAWVYYSAQVFFLGAEMTKVYAMRYGSRSKARQKHPQVDSGQQHPPGE